SRLMASATATDVKSERRLSFGKRILFFIVAFFSCETDLTGLEDLSGLHDYADFRNSQRALASKPTPTSASSAAQPRPAELSAPVVGNFCGDGCCADGGAGVGVGSSSAPTVMV